MKKYVKTGSDDEDTDVSSASDAESSSHSDDDLDSDEEETITSKGAKRLADQQLEKEKSTKRSKIDDGNRFRDPSAEELTQLRETENLYNSSLFRMQIEELLGEVELKDKRRQKIDSYIHKLSDFLRSLPEGESHQLTEKKWVKELKVKVPITQKPLVKKGVFKFVPPRQVHVVGSYLLKTCVKPDIHVDLAMEIPQSFFEDKDYLNERYSRKRALYLATIASLILNSDLRSDLQFTYHHGNCLQPVLIIKPTNDLGKSFTVRLHVTVEEGAFRLTRFNVNKCNLRQQWYTKPGRECTDEDQASPVYNSLVLRDLCLLTNTNTAVSAVRNTDGVRKALMLLKVWIHQRGLDKGCDSATSFILTMYVVYLLSQRKLNRSMSSYQVLRNTFLCLGESDWINQPISLAPSHLNDPNKPLPVDFQREFDVVFIDSTGHLNLCAGWSRSTYEWLKHEAKTALKLLSSPGMDGFDGLFMTPMPFNLKFDQTFHISELGNLREMIKKNGVQHQLVDHHGDVMATAIPHLLRLLHKALGNRVQLISVKPGENVQWSVMTVPPMKLKEDDIITLGLLLNPDHATSMIDKGPSADTPDAQEFRDFWGDKSELRRFQDGRICEAVVWNCSTLSEKRLVTSYIVKHVLQRHACISRTSVKFLSKQLDPLLALPAPSKKHRAVPYGTGEEQHNDAMQVFNRLSKEIRALKDLPLAITNIQGTSPLFRFAEVFPARPCYEAGSAHRSGNRLLPSAESPCPSYTPSLDVLCVLEGSGKWPEDLEAVHRLKAAFYVQLASDLNQNYSLPTAAYPDHILVSKEGYVFRLILAYMHEIAMTKTVTTPQGLVKVEDNEASRLLERRYHVLPRLTSTLHGIHQQFNSFSGTVRLAKRWLSAHMMLGDGHILEEAIEILVAYLYLHPAPYTPPSTPLVGFLRFLRLLSSHDWQNTPLIVNLNEEFSSEDFTAIHNAFTMERSEQPLMFLATPSDRSSFHWTRHAPSAPILQRMASLSHRCLHLLTSQIENVSTDVDFKKIFRPSLEVFDAVIHLNVSNLPRAHQAIEVDSKSVSIPKVNSKADKSENQILPVVDFDPAELFIQELRDTFGHLALFFNDLFGGSVVGVLWKPCTKEAQEFKVVNIDGRTLDVDATEPRLLPHWSAILEDFKLLGGGLVSKIEVSQPQYMSPTPSR